MAGRICPSKGCPTIIPAGTARCAPCTKTHDAARGTTDQRGYGTAHKNARLKWAAYLASTGQLPCTRCHQPVYHGDTWHLDHNESRNQYLGIAHPTCNTSAAGTHAANLNKQHQ